MSIPATIQEHDAVVSSADWCSYLPDDPEISALVVQSIHQAIREDDLDPRFITQADVDLYAEVWASHLLEDLSI